MKIDEHTQEQAENIGKGGEGGGEGESWRKEKFILVAKITSLSRIMETQQASYFSTARLPHVHTVRQSWVVRNKLLNTNSTAVCAMCTKEDHCCHWQTSVFTL